MGVIECETHFNLLISLF